MRHIMLDIETLSTRSNAALVSIGACTFDPEHVDGDTDNRFLVGIDPEWYDSVFHAFDVDPETVKWWSKQSKAARDSLLINQAQTLPLAMDKLVEWFEDVGFEKENWDIVGRVWANPPQFDMVILRNAADYCYGSSNDVPWHYRQETCCRTHMALFRGEGLSFKGASQGLVKHRADHDAVRQARVVQMIEELRRCGS